MMVTVSFYRQDMSITDITSTSVYSGLMLIYSILYAVVQFCEVFQSPANGLVMQTGTIENSVATYTCDLCLSRMEL